MNPLKLNFLILFQMKYFGIFLLLLAASNALPASHHQYNAFRIRVATRSALPSADPSTTDFNSKLRQEVGGILLNILSDSNDEPSQPVANKTKVFRLYYWKVMKYIPYILDISDRFIPSISLQIVPHSWVKYFGVTTILHR